MARKQTLTLLPPLERVFPEFAGLAETDNKQQFVTEALRTVAQQFRSKKSCAFYTMRSVAAFFSVPLRTVAIAYERLEKEGLVSRVRSAHTILTGRDSFLRFPVRGVVGLPIWLNTMVASSFTRRVNMELETRLRKHGFVADLIFHHSKEEEANPDFAELLLLHHLDIVIWQNPHPRSRQNLLTLHERGVRLLVIQTLEAKADLPAAIYLQDWNPGIHELATRWTGAGVKKVWVPLNSKNLDYKSEAEIFAKIFREHGLRVEVCEASISALPQLAATAKTGRESAIAFLDLPTADYFCNREPLAMEQVSKLARLAFCRGPIRCQYLQSRGVQIEVVAFCPVEVSKKLAQDIQILPDIFPGVRHTFKARYWEDNTFEPKFDSF